MVCGIKSHYTELKNGLYLQAVFININILSNLQKKNGKWVQQMKRTGKKLNKYDRITLNNRHKHSRR